MNLLIKQFLRKAVAAAAIVAFFFLRGQMATELWVPVAIAAFACFAFELLTFPAWLTDAAYIVIAFVSFIGFNGGSWAIAGVFAFPIVLRVLMGFVHLLNGSNSATPAAPSK